MSPGWGCPHPPRCLAWGLAAAHTPGHKPVPAAPGTVAGTPGRLPRPPAHTTHERWRAAGLSGFPGLPAPLPATAPPTIPSQSLLPKAPSLLPAVCVAPGPPLPSNLGSSSSRAARRPLG